MKTGGKKASVGATVKGNNDNILVECEHMHVWHCVAIEINIIEVSKFIIHYWHMMTD